MDADARLEALTRENERLRARIEDLESHLGHDFTPPLEWRLTVSEARVFGCIYRSDFATKAAIMAALYRDFSKDEALPKIVDVFVCRMRRKLKPWQIEIETRWGEGYFLSKTGKARVAALMGQLDS